MHRGTFCRSHWLTAAGLPKRYLTLRSACSEQSGERRDLKYGVQCRKSEHATIGVSNYRTQRIIDSRPPDASKDCNQGRPAQSDRFGAQSVKSESLVPGCATIVRAFALKHRFEAVIRRIEDHKVRSRRDMNFEAGRDVRLIVTARSHE